MIQKTKTFNCQCGTEVLRVIHDSNCSENWSFQRLSVANDKPFWRRLKEAWLYLIKGDRLDWDIILLQYQVKELVSFLNDNVDDRQ